jgi:hypothetical protein
MLRKCSPRASPMRGRLQRRERATARTRRTAESPWVRRAFRNRRASTAAPTTNNTYETTDTQATATSRALASCRMRWNRNATKGADRQRAIQGADWPNTRASGRHVAAPTTTAGAMDENRSHGTAIHLSWLAGWNCWRTMNVCKRSTNDALARAGEVQRSVSAIRQGNKAS